MKIALLIPSTSHKRNWKDYKESYLYTETLKSFLLTYDKEHSYVFYIGIDRNDRIYDNEETQKELKRFCSVMKNTEIIFDYMDNIAKGHLTIMWNKLFSQAYLDKCDYFFQCGDDIQFKTKGWVNSCINCLTKSNNIGLTGPLNNNSKILTQSFVSRKHMDIFGYYFPEEIINWFCDDWINIVYKKMNKYYPLKEHLCINIGGQPRYEVNNDTFKDNSDFNMKFMQLQKECNKIANKDLKRTRDTFIKLLIQ